MKCVIGAKQILLVLLWFVSYKILSLMVTYHKTFSGNSQAGEENTRASLYSMDVDTQNASIVNVRYVHRIDKELRNSPPKKPRNVSHHLATSSISPTTLGEETNSVQVDRKLVFYNRIPKSGSQAVRGVIRQLKKSNKFSNLPSDYYEHHYRNQSQQEKIARHVSNLTRPSIYDKHVGFINFAQFGLAQPIYINVIRDPVENRISGYYWARYHLNIIKSEARRNMTFDECVALDDVECDAHSGHQGGFLCGADIECRHKTPSTMARAKHNVEKHYTLVGLSEDLGGFFKALEKLLPSFFTNATLTYKRESSSLYKTYRSKKKDEVSFQSRDMLRQRYAFDYEIHAFVKQKYHEILEKLHIS